MDRASSQAQQRKGLAIVFCLFLALMWKQYVFDAYFNPTRPVGQQQAAVTGGDAAQASRGALGNQPPVAGSEFVQPVAQNAALNAPQVGNASSAGKVVPGGELYPTDSAVTGGGEVSVETDTIKVEISLIGGRVTKLLLKDYREQQSADSPPLNLMQHVERAPYPLAVYSDGIDDSQVQYTLANGANNGPRTVSGAGEERIVLNGTLSDGRTIQKTVVVHGDGYFLDVNAKLDRPAKDGSKAMVEWTRFVPVTSSSYLDPYHTDGFVWFDGQKTLREAFSKLRADMFDIPSVRWLAIADKYFMAALIGTDINNPDTVRVERTGQLYRAILMGGDREVSARVFAGPKGYRLLQHSGSDLHRAIDFGWTGVIAAPLLALLHTLYALVGNYGLAIVLLTIIVKTVLYPLNARAFTQMKAMQDLAPDLKRIKESITDKAMQQQEMMALYKKKGVNPLGGCFPVLIQMPVFIGLYSALMLAIELRHAPFALWITDLSAQERLHIAGFGVPVMVLLFCLSMVVQQATTPSNLEPAQKRVMMFMPLVFGFMFATMPAGLTLYWLTNNTISIGQQISLRRGNQREAALITGGTAFGIFVLAFLLTRM